MRAAVFKGPGQKLSIERVDDPVPGRGEVVLKVGRCGICGTDLHMTEGHGVTYPSGTVPGHEVAGEVVDVGPGVDRLKVGDRIAAMPLIGCGRCASCVAGTPRWCKDVRFTASGYAEYALAGQSEAVELPAGLSFADGALVEPLAVGLHGVLMAGFAPDARVLVMGAGPIGLAVTYWARRIGVRNIVVVANSSRREALAYEMGASKFIVTSDDAVVAVDRVLGGRPDCVFECVGLPGMIDRAIHHVRPRGTAIVLGACTTSDAITPMQALMKEIRVQFSLTYSRADYETVVQALDSGAVAPRLMITDTISLDALPEVFEALRRPTVHCKVMIDPWKA